VSSVTLAPRHPLADRRFLALLVVSFLVSFCNAPRYALLPIYVEAQLLRSPLFSAGLRSIFLILGGVFALVAGRLADRFGVKRIYLLGTLGPVVTGLVFLVGDPLLLASLCVGIGAAQGFDSAGGQSYLISAVGARQIGTAIYYPRPLHELEPCQPLAKHGPWLHSETASRETLALPFFPEMTEAQLDAVADALADVVPRRRR